MIYYANCKHCRAKWRVVAPNERPLDLNTAIGIMEKALCPCCGNDGSRAPVNWKFSFGGSEDPHYGQTRRKEA